VLSNGAFSAAVCSDLLVTEGINYYFNSEEYKEYQITDFTVAELLDAKNPEETEFF